MQGTLIWDLPVRLTHWLLAALFLGAFGLATLTSDESTSFAWHAVLGMTAVFLVVLRVLWALVGTRYARFGSFTFRLDALARHFRGAPSPSPGHNPATSWFAVLLFVGLCGLGLTGFSMARGNETFEDVHQVIAWTLLVLVALHVLGLIVHWVKTRENLPVTMITGRKVLPEASGIPDASGMAAVGLLVLVAGFGAMLVSGFDPAARRLTLPLVGTPLTIGEAVEGTTAGEPATPGAGEHEEDEDDD